MSAQVEDLLVPARRFLESVDAVRELHQFALANSGQLDDRRSAWSTVAARHLPTMDREKHDAAIDVIDRMQEEVGAAAATLGSQAPVSELTDRVKEIFRRASVEVESVTGDDSAFVHYLNAISEAQSQSARLPVLRSSLLTTLVSNFEVLVGSLIRSFYEFKPEATRQFGKEYRLEELERFESMADVRSFAIDHHAESLMRGSFSDWMEWFLKQLKIKDVEISPDLARLDEVFQRRHLFVHNGGIVNRLYNSKTSTEFTRPLGDQLVVEDDYLDRAIDLILVSGALLAARVMVKLLPVAEGGGHAGDALIADLTYKHLLSERWSSVLELSDKHHVHALDESNRLVMRVNAWVATRKLHPERSDEVKRQVREWQTAALGDQFQLARLALLDEYEAASRLGDTLLASGRLDVHFWATWPLLEHVRAWEKANRPREQQLALSVEMGDD